MPSCWPEQCWIQTRPNTGFCRDCAQALMTAHSLDLSREFSPDILNHIFQYIGMEELQYVVRRY